MIIVHGECIRCGKLVSDDEADLHLTVPGRGMFAGKVFKAELICKNASLCQERQANATAA